MKRNIITFIFTSVLLFVGCHVRAQIVSICLDEDSVTLTLDNYQYGNIQWQKSNDNVNWENIDGAISRTYTCFPENSTYFRAWISYQTCPPDSSQVSFLQRKIKANAGPDKVLSTGFTTELFANHPDGTIGHWSLLAGEDAQISDPDSSYTLFYGTDSLYRLCWTLTGACGTSIDTIEISYVTNVYNDRVVFVDTTDIIVSDSAEIADGSLRIVFSDPVTISYATILVGLQGDGFLRKVESCIYIGDTCCMNTTQATLSDILVSGTIHIEDFASIIRGRERNIPNLVPLNHCPTRAEILSDTLFRSDKVYYYIEAVEAPTDGSMEKNAVISFPSLGSPISLGTGIQITGLSLECHPHLGIEMTSRWIEPVSLSFGSCNGDFEARLKLRFPDNSVTISAMEKTIWKKKIRLRVMIGGFPIFTSLNFKLSTSMDGFVNYTEPFEVEIVQHTDYDAMVYVNDGIPSRDFSARGNLSFNVEDYDDELRTGEGGVEVALLGEVAITFYGAVSAYFDIGPKAGWSICVGNDGNGHWGNQQGAYVQGYLQVGLRPAALLHFTGDWDVNFPYDFLKTDMRRPNRIGYISGGNQRFAGSNVPLPQPIRVKSYDFFNNPSSNNYIYFEPENGGFVNSSDNHFVTDEDGIAEAIWYPETPESRLKVGAFDCNGNYINGEPIIISTTGDVCETSTLTTRAVFDGRLVNLLVSGGVPPYRYSLDGLTYEDQFTPFAPQLGTEYTIHVKDAQNCESISAYTRPGPYNEIICLDDNSSIPLSRCFIEDQAEDHSQLNDCERIFVVDGTSGGLCLYMGSSHASQPLLEGTYTGVTCGENGNPGSFRFCKDYSWAFDSFWEDPNDEGRAISNGEMTYIRESDQNVLTFTYTDEHGHSYVGAYTGPIEYTIWTLRGSKSAKKGRYRNNK